MRTEHYLAEKGVGGRFTIIEFMAIIKLLKMDYLMSNGFNVDGFIDNRCVCVCMCVCLRLTFLPLCIKYEVNRLNRGNRAI